MRKRLEKINLLYSYQYAKNYFKVGVFLLLSAPAISVIFLIPSALVGLGNRKKSLLKEKLNYFLIISSIIMFLSCVHNSFKINFPYESWSPSLSWYGLANWIPLFICFLGFQPFLDSIKERREISLLFLFGTIPLIVSGILQYFFKVYGPFETLNGLIIWFARSLKPEQGLTGLFNNSNYAGAWLSLVYPFSLALCLEKKRKRTKFVSLLIFLLIVLVSIFTFSRSNWLNIGLGTFFVLGKSSILLILPILILIISLLIGCFYGIDFLKSNDFFGRIFLDNFCSKFEEIGFANSHRIIIWKNAIELIKNKVIFGYGASAFSTLYFIRSGRFTTHSHNILTEIAINYGVIVAVMIAIFVTNLIIEGFKIIFLNGKTNRPFVNYDKAWWASIFVITLSHLYDNQYYDLRISISSWILLAGLRNIIRESRFKLY